MRVSDYYDAKWQTVEATGTRYKLLNDPELGEKYQFEATVRHYVEAEYNVKAHRHKIEQVRYILTGDAGPSNGMSSPPGSVNYIGASTFYGPYDRPENVEYFSLKFGGTEDPKFPFPKPRFTTPVVFHPKNFDSVEISPCAHHREFASFGEKGTHIFILTLDGGGCLELKDDRTTVIFVTSGQGSADEVEIGPRDSVTIEPGERLMLASDVGLELFVVHLPSLRDESPASLKSA